MVAASARDATQPTQTFVESETQVKYSKVEDK